ncbi:L,D-transpeptidase [Oricola thermophila]|uniref:L,D-transpeptidase n=1 Tax=Oricola thermophila TaxID=2742145 RepID=A0A6N1VJL1_9HYPH|nr:L,D-transpeptidase [Oricola thermophila]QKV20613.1 L,D-transpeptidase [Oricola thermophila]
MKTLSRRKFLTTSATFSAGLALSACNTVNTPARIPLRSLPEFPPYATMYGPVSDGGFNIPGVPYTKIPERFLRQVVKDPTGEKKGTIVVDTRGHFLFLVLGNGYAIRYGVGLGRAGFEWSGRAEIGAKREWPKWFPPDEMIDRDPKLEKYRVSYDAKNDVYNGGMEPGIYNPLGARALYLYEGKKDTLYRLHGSPEWNSIGKSVSSGCVRLLNQDILDLYDRVPIGTPVLVR